MSAMQRGKGAVGELDLICLLRVRIGDLPGLHRNLEQFPLSRGDFHAAWNEAIR